ncbi:MAG: hypothetical protein OXH69_01740 [Acidobacteria bacterium]|nr:hypothetical protein [Acidobacteriota bacterium]
MAIIVTPTTRYAKIARSLHLDAWSLEEQPEKRDSARRTERVPPWYFIGALCNQPASGLDDTRAYPDGDRAGFAMHEIEFSNPDVAAIRSKAGLSQPSLARSIGISLGALKNREQGRCRPEGPARVLLALIDERPSIVQEGLGR